MKHDQLYFTGAKFANGKIRVDVFHEPHIAAMNYSLMRTLGGPRRIVMGKGAAGLDKASVRRAVEELLRAA